jgi:hypothetical protein
MTLVETHRTELPPEVLATAEVPLLEASENYYDVEASLEAYQQPKRVGQVVLSSSKGFVRHPADYEYVFV